MTEFHHDRPRIGFGPEMPGWGSWDWTGVDVLHSLRPYFETCTFAAWEVPDCDLLVVIKHAPPMDWMESARHRSAIVYSPVDAYGSAAEIDADRLWLRHCARILIHCERLRRYFEPYAPVSYMDHHIKFAAPLRETFRSDGNVLWVGVRSNLPPLVAWANTHAVPAPLDVLTNFESSSRPPSPTEMGFLSQVPVRLHEWSPERQIELTRDARCILDIKGSEFRARHKPPAKALDAIASGVPLAMNRDSSPFEHLATLGFEICDSEDVERWFSWDYAEETRRFGAAIRELLSLDRVAWRYRRIFEEVLKQRPRGPTRQSWELT